MEGMNTDLNLDKFKALTAPVTFSDDEDIGGPDGVSKLPCQQCQEKQVLINQQAGLMEGMSQNIKLYEDKIADLKSKLKELKRRESEGSSGLLRLNTASSDTPLPPRQDYEVTLEGFNSYVEIDKKKLYDDNTATYCINLGKNKIPSSWSKMVQAIVTGVQTLHPKSGKKKLETLNYVRENVICNWKTYPYREALEDSLSAVTIGPVTTIDRMKLIVKDKGEASKKEYKDMEATLEPVTIYEALTIIMRKSASQISTCAAQFRAAVKNDALAKLKLDPPGNKDQPLMPPSSKEDEGEMTSAASKEKATPSVSNTAPSSLFPSSKEDEKDDGGMTTLAAGYAAIVATQSHQTEVPFLLPSGDLSSKPVDEITPLTTPVVSDFAASLKNLFKNVVEAGPHPPVELLTSIVKPMVKVFALQLTYLLYGGLEDNIVCIVDGMSAKGSDAATVIAVSPQILKKLEAVLDLKKWETIVLRYLYPCFGSDDTVTEEAYKTFSCDAEYEGFKLVMFLLSHDMENFCAVRTCYTESLLSKIFKYLIEKVESNASSVSSKIYTRWNMAKCNCNAREKLNILPLQPSDREYLVNKLGLRKLACEIPEERLPTVLVDAADKDVTYFDTPIIKERFFRVIEENDFIKSWFTEKGDIHVDSGGLPIPYYGVICKVTTPPDGCTRSNLGDCTVDIRFDLTPDQVAHGRQFGDLQKNVPVEHIVLDLASMFYTKAKLLSKINSLLSKENKYTGNGANKCIADLKKHLVRLLCDQSTTTDNLDTPNRLRSKRNKRKAGQVPLSESNQDIKKTKTASAASPTNLFDDSDEDDYTGTVRVPVQRKKRRIVVPASSSDSETGSDGTNTMQ